MWQSSLDNPTESPQPSEIPAIRNPYRSGIVALAVLDALLFIPAILALWIIIGERLSSPLFIPAIIGAGLFFLIDLSLAALLIGGHRKVRQIRAFLASGRPSVRWTYTPEEWQALKEIQWQAARGDWKIQLGCMTGLFGFVGLLAGLPIGLEEGIPEALLSGLIGTTSGLLIGGALGAAVAGGNYLAAKLDYRSSTPGMVALAPNELYANGQYFRGNGESTGIRSTALEHGDPTILHVEVRVPLRPRGPSDETWEIIVPQRMVASVETALHI